MSRRLHRLRRKRVLIPLGILLGLFGVVSFLLGTTPGARWVLGQALGKSPVPVSIASIEGRLLGPLHLRGIVVHHELAELTVGHVELDWSAPSLFSKTLHVKRLLVEDVDAELSPAPTETTPAEKPAAGPPAPIALPISIVVDDARVSRVRLLLADAVELQQLQFALRGRADDYRFELATHVQGENVPSTDIELHATGTLTDVVVDSLVVETLEGVVKAQAAATWYPQVTWKAEVTADRVQPGLLAPDPEQWAGQLSMALRSEGRIHDEAPTGWAALDSLRGDLRGEAVHASGRADFRDLRHASGSFSLAWSAVEAKLEGAVGDSLRAAVHVACEDLSQLAPGLQGAVRLDANADGPLDGPLVQADLAGKDLSTGPTGVSVASVWGRLEGTASKSPQGRLDLLVLDAQVGEVTQDSTVLALDGNRGHQTLRLSTFGEELQAALAVSGDLAPDSLLWAGGIDTLTVRHELAGEWRLLDRARVEATPTSATLKAFRFGADDAELQLDAAWQDSTWSASGAIVHLPLSLANAGLPEPQRLGGHLEGKFAGSGALAGAFEAELEAALADARLYFELEERPDSLLFEDAHLTAAAGVDGVHGDLGLSITSAQRPVSASVAAEFALPQFTSLADSLPAQPVTATLTGNLPDLGVFEGLNPLVSGLKGHVDLSAEVAGSVAAPEVTAELRAAEGAFTVDELGLTVQDIAVDASGDPTSGLHLSGQAQSGQGRLEVSGEIPPKPSADTPVKVSLRGERFQVVDTTEIDVQIQPDLEVTFDGDRLLISGELLLPRVVIELVEAPAQAVAVSSDAIVVDSEQEPVTPPVDTWVDVQITLGDEVVFRGFAMSIELEGGLHVQQHVPDPPRGQGEIRIVDGFYRAYGQNLTIDEGVISFAGPVENPGLNIRAYRETLDGVIAGLLITGTAESPQLKVYSEPALPETQAISYLVTGRSLEAGGDQGSVAGTAALLGSNVLSSQLGNKVGLDEARIETSGALDEASLVTGKYLSPQIYLSYAMGLFDRSNLVRVRYIFSPKWAAQAETGTAMGTDLFYKIERGN